MSTRELLKLVEERGLKVAVRDGRPVLVRAAGSEAVTDKLLAVLKRHRQAIVELLAKDGK